MSLVIAIKTSEGILMGTDSLIVDSGENVELVEVESCQKIWEMVSPMKDNLLTPVNLMGGVGTYRNIMAIRHTLSYYGTVDMRNVINTIAPDIVAILRSYDFISRESPIGYIDASFIIANREHIIVVDEDLTVTERSDFAAIGNAAHEANILLKDRYPAGTPLLTRGEAMALLEEVFRECAKNNIKIQAPFYFLES